MEQRSDGAEILENDILFDCPYCGKSLAIEERGAGLMIHCPDCGESVRVPDRRDDGKEAAPEAALINELQQALAASQERVRALVEEVQDLRARRNLLESQRTHFLKQIERVRTEVKTARDAVDRMAGHLEAAMDASEE